jgi:hypothetical protein
MQSLDSPHGPFDPSRYKWREVKGDGVLYEIVDEESNVIAETTIAVLVDDWKANT